MRSRKRRSTPDPDAARAETEGGVPTQPVVVTDTGNAHAHDGATALTGYRGPVPEPASPSTGGLVQVSGTGDAIASGGGTAISGYINELTVVQQAAPRERASWPHQIGFSRRPWDRRTRVTTVASVFVSLALVTVVVITVKPQDPLQPLSFRTWSCSKDGFTGEIWAAYRKYTTGRVAFIGQIKYKIEKGSNPGGKRANITWTDPSTTPATVFSTGNGIQDNTWHLLTPSTGYKAYYPHASTMKVKFTFDSNSSKPEGNPSCDGHVKLP